MPSPRVPRAPVKLLPLSLPLLLGAATHAEALNIRVLVSSGTQVTVRVPATPAPAPEPEAALAPAASPAAPGAALPMAAWKVGTMSSAPNARLTLNGKDAGNTTLYLPPTPGSVVEISGKLYRGGVLLRAQQGGVQAINVVDVEDYLRGVVASEMPASWPDAALRAQAVIARTYVASRINPAAPYDTCATEKCQVYTGVGGEKPTTDAAITATAGQVVAYGGKAATTYFSSDSGGFTASAKEVWNMDLPYLPAKADPFSAGGPKASWRLDLSAAQVAEVAARYGVRVGTLKNVAVTRASESGRPQEITLSGSGGVKRISGASAGGFVRSLGASSSRATLSYAGGKLTVQGSGNGHGVGLSQYGALGLAKAGYDHLHVLGFYYPGTALSRLADAGPRSPLRPSLRELAALPALNEPLRLNHTLRVNAFAPVPAFPLAFRPDLNAQ
ncbi:SpoIID/LytB domain-containing protein [Deinococcus taklimakanensis]|uniref:SpoIID/LytB domain-containing protein n=1 Tax=Deinococcus taklimakanensis TaxID=536443 RepID=A0ABW5P1S8_9DEIO